MNMMGVSVRAFLLNCLPWTFLFIRKGLDNVMMHPEKAGGLKKQEVLVQPHRL